MCKRLLVVVLMMSVFVSIKAQLTEADSLSLLLQKGGQDSARVDILNQLGPLLRQDNPEKALTYMNEAHDLSLKVGYHAGAALALKNLGILNFYSSRYAPAIKYYQESLKYLDSTGNNELKGLVLSNIGAAYFQMSEDSKAVDYYLRSMKVAEMIKDTERIATLYSNIGAVYFRKPTTHDKALENYKKADEFAANVADLDAKGTIAVNLGEVYMDQGNDSLALFYFNKSIGYLKNSLVLPYTLNALGNYYRHHKEYERALNYHQQALDICKRLGLDFDAIIAYMGIGDTYMQTGDFKLAVKNYSEAEILAKNADEKDQLKQSYKRLAISYAQTRDFKKAYEYQTSLTTIQDMLYNDSTSQKINNLQFDFEMQKKEGEIDLLTRDKNLQDLLLQRQKVVTNSLIVVVLLVFAIGIIIYQNYRAKVATNKILDSQKAEIESLLLNILPAEVAQELQRNGSATPRYYESASVLFTDFKGFTILADKFSPQALVAQLNETFIAFDAIIEKYNLEKIKTIGDAYMCAGGIPSTNTTHPSDIIQAGFEIIQWMEGANRLRIEKGEEPWYLRIGVHTGPIVAGVVGRAKYAYDIWGSTVNVASRMESNGEPGYVNISASTYELVKDQFACTYRGKIYAKNVGEIDMYFVDQALDPKSILSSAIHVKSCLN
jgi:class 3 adenylate cyclase